MTARPSRTFRNSREIKKLVDEERVVGFVIIGNSKHGGATVSPLYEAQVFVAVRSRRGKPVTHVFTGYEHGDAYNGQYIDDPEGHALASVAAIAIARLEERVRTLQLAAATGKKKKGRRK